MLFQALLSRVLLLPYTLPAIILVLSAREFAYSLAVYHLTDKSFRQKGAVSINPFRYFDPLGFILLALVGFGWENHAPVNISGFKDRKKGLALAALSGPLANILIAYLTIIISLIFYKYHIPFNGHIEKFINIFVSINLSIAVFTMLPIPPLDGAKVFFALLPDRLYFKMMGYERVTFVILLVLLFSGLLNGPIANAVTHLWNGLFHSAQMLLKMG